MEVEENLEECVFCLRQIKEREKQKEKNKLKLIKKNKKKT